MIASPPASAVLNGAGEMIGITAIDEWGVLETPIFLTSSMAIGRVYDAAVELLVERVPSAGVDDALMPVVAECDDGYLNASRTVQVEPERCPGGRSTAPATPAAARSRAGSSGRGWGWPGSSSRAASAMPPGRWRWSSGHGSRRSAPTGRTDGRRITSAC